MDRFNLFIACDARQATHRLSDEGQLEEARTSKCCGYRDEFALFLCDSCAEFRRECMDQQDQTGWHLAVFLRELEPSIHLAPTRQDTPNHRSRR